MNIYKIISIIVSIIADKLECCYDGIIMLTNNPKDFPIIVSIIADKLECCYAGVIMITNNLKDFQ